MAAEEMGIRNIHIEVNAESLIKILKHKVEAPWTVSNFMHDTIVLSRFFKGTKLSHVMCTELSDLHVLISSDRRWDGCIQSKW